MGNHILTSESGTFYIDDNGIVRSFVPSADNPFMAESAQNDEVFTDKTISTFVVPQGVKGFPSDFMRGVRVLERFVLPEGLLSIGNNSFDSRLEQHCVFANCILPQVNIPSSVQTLGNYAFGHSHLESLQLPPELHAPYGRQFKDSFVGELRLPKEWEGKVWLDGNSLCHKLPVEQYDYLRWPSTYVERLTFYDRAQSSSEAEKQIR